MMEMLTVSLVSTLMGYTMVIAAFIVICPQIVTVLKEQRVDGLTLPSLIFDLIAGMMGFTINWSLGNPLSVYGELIPVLCNISLLSYLVTLYRYGASMARLYISTVIITFILLLIFQPFTLIWYLNLPVALAALFGKAQQSWSLHVSQDAGVLSLSSAVMGAAGLSVRSFTVMVLYTETELDKRDPVGLVITAFMLLFHYIIVYQVFIYSNPELIKKKDM